MRSLEKACSMRKARIASFALRAIDTSLVKRKFFATCCVMVEAPTGRRSDPRWIRFVQIAWPRPTKSIPGWE
jgi:hypothetical protein